MSLMKGPGDCFQGSRSSGEKGTEKRSIPILLATLKECGMSRNLQRGTEAHSRAIQSGLHRDSFVATSLIKMYSRCGSITQARKVFDQLETRDAVAWTAIITGYVTNGESERALEIFDSMQSCSGGSELTPDARLYVAVISACASLARTPAQVSKSKLWVEKGKKIHSLAISNKCCNMFVDNTLLELLARGGCMQQARGLFESMADRNVVTWTCLIQGYVDSGDNESALEIFEASRDRSIADGRIYVAALSGCGKLAAQARKRMNATRSRELFEKVAEIHQLAMKNKCCDTVVENALIDVFARCGSMADSRRVFEGMANRNVISWTSLLQGYVESGESEVALELFDRMQRNCAPNARTFTVALSACAASAASKLKNKDRNIWLDKGVRIHLQALRMNRCNIFVENSLLNLYWQCREMELARKLFNKMPKRDVVSWNTMIIGLVENRENEQALELLRRMSCRRDAATYVAVLKACGNLLALEKARSFHREIVESGLEQEIEVANSLLDVYSKCGSIELAQEVFNLIKSKTIVSWTTLMFGYAAQGNQAGEVFELFERMKRSGLKPDAVSFVCLLTACNHAGMVDRGTGYFDSMSSVYGVKPSLEHYTCMVDLLGKGKCLEEAWRMLETMEIDPDEVVLTAVLAACNNNMSSEWEKSFEIANLAYERLKAMGSRAGFVLMSSICRKAATVNSSRSGSCSAPGLEAYGRVSWIDSAEKLHIFGS